jgi:hypothetical protein
MKNRKVGVWGKQNIEEYYGVIFIFINCHKNKNIVNI